MRKIGLEAETLKSRIFSVQGVMANGFAAVGGGIGVQDILTQTAQFETALADMGKVTGRSLKTIKQEIMALPPELGTATELMEGYYNVMSAGVTEPFAAMERLITASKAAKGAHVQQAEVIKALTNVMAGFAGEMDSATAASDLFFGIEKKGQTTVAELVPHIGSLAALSREAGLGAVRALQDYSNAAADASRNVEQLMGTAFSGIENAFRLTTEGMRVEWSSMVNSMLTDLMRLTIRQSILAPLAGAIGSGLSGLFGTGAIPMDGVGDGWKNNFITNGPSYFDAAVGHSGMMVGHDVGDGLRAVPASIFNSAPRYHEGAYLKPDEVPAILQTGERVLNRRETAAYHAGINQSAQPNITIPMEIVVHYEGQERPSVTRQRNRMDGERMVVELWLSAFENNTLGIRDKISQG